VTRKYLLAIGLTLVTGMARAERRSEYRSTRSDRRSPEPELAPVKERTPRFAPQTPRSGLLFEDPRLNVP